MSNYESLEGKRCIIKLNAEDESFKGTVQKAKAGAVLFKRSGKSQVELLEDTEFEFINEIKTAASGISAKRLNPIREDNAKQHLADRHGYQLASINAMSDADAFAFHAGIDHAEGDLGHYHAEPPAKKEKPAKDPEVANREAAIAQAGAELASA